MFWRLKFNTQIICVFRACFIRQIRKSLAYLAITRKHAHRPMCVFEGAMCVFASFSNIYPSNTQHTCVFEGVNTQHTCVFKFYKIRRILIQRKYSKDAITYLDSNKRGYSVKKAPRNCPLWQ
jgi:hypothetical protein